MACPQIVSLAPGGITCDGEVKALYDRLPQVGAGTNHPHWDFIDAGVHVRIVRMASGVCMQSMQGRCKRGAAAGGWVGAAGGAGLTGLAQALHCRGFVQ